jgi:hypothetical protein
MPHDLFLKLNFVSNILSCIMCLTFAYSHPISYLLAATLLIFLFFFLHT